MSEISQVYTTPDGQTFATKAEAVDHLRRPKIMEAFMKLTSGNEELANWLADNKEVVDNAFDVGTIRRVTKGDKKKLLSALEKAKELFDGGEHALKFLAENVENIHEGFRYPTQKRMSDEERAVAAKNTLVSETDNEELADWVIENRDAILEGYNAGKEKRPVNEKATKGLAEYRVRRATEKLEKLQAALSGASGDEKAEIEEAILEAEQQLENAQKNLAAL